MEWLDYCKSFIPKLKAYYKQMMHMDLNLENPKLYTEKVQWLKIYDSSFLKTYCTDKITVHDYVITKLGKDICIPILKTYNKPEEIKLDELPNKFVIKCNHGSGMNIVVKDKTKLNLSQVKQRLNVWLNQDFSNSNGCELHYKNIPHKILIEEYKENPGHSDLTDYKIHCFNGNPIWCQIFLDRHTNKTVSNYDMNWNYSPQYDWIEYKSRNNIKKPKHFEQMKEYAKILSKDFKICRCDFYEINDELYLGELTFTPDSGFDHFVNKETNKKLGDLLII